MQFNNFIIGQQMGRFLMNWSDFTFLLHITII